jgi:hypothetical protein
MAYIQGGLIEAVDFNTFRTQLLQVYGVGFGNSGYGQTLITVPPVAGGLIEIVKSLEWTAFRNAIEVCQLHQGISGVLLPPTSELQPGDLIVAHDGVTDTRDFPTMLNNITTTRLTAPPTSTSLFLARSSQTISGPWTTQATTTVDLVFPSVDAARYFFNSGGEIRIRASRTGGSVNAQNTSWTDLLNNVGSVVLNHNSTTRTGTVGTGSAFGYYNLPTINPLQTIFTAAPPATPYYFAVNRFVVSARTLGVTGVNGNNGLTVRLKIDLNDLKIAAPDNVNGTLNILIDERRATTFLTVPSFTVSIVAPLSIV